MDGFLPEILAPFDHNLHSLLHNHSANRESHGEPKAVRSSTRVVCLECGVGHLLLAGAGAFLRSRFPRSQPFSRPFQGFLIQLVHPWVPLLNLLFLQPGKRSGVLVVGVCHFKDRRAWRHVVHCPPKKTYVFPHKNILIESNKSDQFQRSSSYTIIIMSPFSSTPSILVNREIRGKRFFRSRAYRSGASVHFDELLGPFVHVYLLCSDCLWKEGPEVGVYAGDDRTDSADVRRGYGFVVRLLAQGS